MVPRLSSSGSVIITLSPARPPLRCLCPANQSRLLAQPALRVSVPLLPSQACQLLRQLTAFVPAALTALRLRPTASKASRPFPHPAIFPGILASPLQSQTGKNKKKIRAALTNAIHPQLKHGNSEYDGEQMIDPHWVASDILLISSRFIVPSSILDFLQRTVLLPAHRPHKAFVPLIHVNVHNAQDFPGR